MRKITAILLAIFAVSAISAQETPQKATIAVTKVSATNSLSQAVKSRGASSSMNRILESIDSNLTSAIQDTRKFEVVSRSDLDAVMREQDFSESGNVDLSDKNAARIGKLKGAKYIVSVAVDDYQDYVRKRSFATLGESTEVRILRLGVVAKIIDSTKGSILETANLVINEELRNSEKFDSAVAGGSATDAVISRMARQMCSKIANRVADVVFPAKIIGKTGKIGTFNRGDGTGVSIGDEYEIFALGEAMIDPDTGENLGAEEVSVGKLRVTSIAPKFSKGTIIEDNGVEKGQVLRLIKKADPIPNDDNNEL